MIDIGLTNALAQIRESKEKDNKCDYCAYNGYYDEDYE